MSQSPAAYLRSLYNPERDEIDEEAIISLLPELADVVEAAEIATASWHDTESSEITVGKDMGVLLHRVRNLAATVSALQRRLPGEGGR